MGSYAAARAGLERVLALPNRPPCYLRAVFTRANLDFAQDVLALLELPVDGVALEPVVGQDPRWSLRDADLARVEAEYERLALARTGASGAADRFLPLALPPEPPAPWGSGRGCGAGVWELAVAPGGDLYPCHRFVGNPDFRLGSVRTGVERPDLMAAFAQATAATKPACQTCWARAWCGGGCHANGYQTHGTICEPDEAECRLRRKRLECAFWLLAERVQEGGTTGAGAPGSFAR